VTEPRNLITEQEASTILGSTVETVVPISDDGDQNPAFRYVAANGSSLTAAYFFKGGKGAFELQTFGKDFPERFGKKQPCDGIGDSCYRPTPGLLHVLKGEVCFSLSIDTSASHQAWQSVDLTARDDLAKRVIDRLP
jgi:hypothetical protein